MKPRWLWAGILAGPLVWLAHLQAGYLLSPWACARGHRVVIGAVTVIALVAIGGALVVAWQAWRQAGATAATEEGSIVGLSRFMALSGMGVSALFALVVIASALLVVLSPCE